MDAAKYYTDTLQIYNMCMCISIAMYVMYEYFVAIHESFHQIESLAGILLVTKPFMRRKLTTPAKTTPWALAASDPA